ncbi:MAG: fatty acid cis/trans isomerase [Deltaproteobacteria bacterium]|nr:fatty acid cis/trans isomerase [Deltaproteobacteria bacterium]MBW2418699.1 fatty acid cis/trans isomerase [Deltaproteobacteria bacterium]
MSLRMQGALLISFLALGLWGGCAPSQPSPELAPSDVSDASALPALSYDEQVQPLLARRCVVCHGCYDAPCQLRMSSAEGIGRGASKELVYDSSRLTAMEPTRLFIDARSPTEWRERGFFDVLSHARGSWREGLLVQMLALGSANPHPPDQRLPASVSLDINRELSCPTAEEFDDYAAEHPLGGMPYGTAPLSHAELAVLLGWAEQASRLPAASPSLPAALPSLPAALPSLPAALPSLPAALQKRVGRWEDFLNGESLKERITARYLYEHWFFAHLYFESSPTGPFFRIVRSSTAPGQPADEIATRRPYDDPGDSPFWYRVVPIDAVIVHKTHIVYPLGPERMRRLSALFLEPDWTPTRLPGYDAKEASNPFVSFDQLPARARYQFLLDDARYFVSTFIRGPVCRGQVAVDVIEDHFFVVFMSPDSDVSVLDPSFLEETKEYLSLPAKEESGFSLHDLWLGHQLDQKRYLDYREKAYDERDPEGVGPSLDFIWDGDGHNRNALLTIFRHFDNATVVQGFVGGMPKTAWVIDYPIFERIYYDLVAGFDVFGSVTHQLSTRLYMDHLRMQGETLFLAFLPEDRREELRASWYRGATRQLGYITNDIRSHGHGTRIGYVTDEPKDELLKIILDRDPRVSGPADLLNRCAEPPCDREGASLAERRIEGALQRLAGVRGPWVEQLPDVAFLRVHSSGLVGKQSAIYTLVHDKAHSNVAVLFREESRREPERDALSIVRGYLGSYPNFVFEVDEAQLGDFIDSLMAVRDAAGLEAVAERWGLRRTSPRFWPSFDWIHADFLESRPTEAGLFDLGRYKNL